MDLRVQKTYSALIQAFEELLSEKDFDKISVNELCERAMIRRPTFYKHFLDKYNFLSFFLKDKFNGIVEHAVESTKDDDPLDFCLNLFEFLVVEMDKMERIVFKIQFDSTLFTELESLFDYGQSVISNYVHLGESQDDIEYGVKYQKNVILATTVQSSFWYNRYKDEITKEFMVERLTKVIEKILSIEN